MSRVDYSPVPTVEARETPPDDLQHIAASPDAFGAQIAQGVDELGAGISQASQFYDQVAATNAVNSTIAQATNVLRGDPGKTVMGPDGQPAPDTGYFGLRGADAMSARGATSTAIQNIIAQNRSSLKTPEAQEHFENEIRKYQADWEGRMGEHADQQQHTWSLDTYGTQATLALNDLAHSPSDDGIASNVTQRVKTAFVRIAQLNGESADGAVLKADQQVTFARARALINTDPVAGKKFLDSNMDLISTLSGTYQLQQDANARALDHIVGTLSDPSTVASARAIASAAPGTVKQTASLTDVQHAIIGQESGGNPNERTSIDGAHGVGQIMPATWAQYAKPGEDINNPTDNRTVANRIIAGYYQKFHGDAGKVAAAYFSGEGNVPAQGDQAFIHDRADGNGKTVSSYVSDVNARLGLAGGAAAAGGDADAAYLMTVRQQLETIFPNDPGPVERGVKQVDVNIKRDDAEQVAKVSQQVNDSATYLINGGDPSKVTLTSAFVRQQLPGGKGQQLATDLQTALSMSKAMGQIATLPQDQVDKLVASFKPTGPQDYSDKAAAYATLSKAADVRRQALFGAGNKQGDPAAYVHSSMPDVAHALDASINSNDPNAFAGYVHKLQGAYGALGVPTSAQRILPNSMASGIVSNLQGAAPGDALHSITAFQKEAGSYWPQVYRDLVHAGMPVSFQTPLIVAESSPQNAQTMISAIQRDADARAHGKPAMEQEIDGIKVNGRSAKTLIDQTIASDIGLRDLRHTFGVAGRAGLDQYNGVEQTVKQTAHYLYLTGRANDPARAAEQAAKMVTGNYDFVQQGDHPPARLPVGTSQDFHQATQFVLNALQPGDVISHAHEVGTNADHDRHVLDSAKQAYWVTIPGADGQGAVRAMDPATGQPVIVKNGSTIDIPFSKMKTVAARNPPSWFSNTFPSIWGK